MLNYKTNQTSLSLFPVVTKPWIGLNRTNATVYRTFQTGVLSKATHVHQQPCMLNNECYIFIYKPSENSRGFSGFDFGRCSNCEDWLKYLEAEDLVITTIYTVFRYRLLSLELDEPWNQHYGTLVKKAGVTNVGDEIQDFPGLQFLPFMDTSRWR